MLIAMYSGISGMSAHQTKLNVIGNNIANVNTYGFKSSRVTFSDVFYQNLQGASRPSTTSGGINSNQLGYGTKVGSIDVINTMSGGADTGRALDVYINGEGYLPVKGGDGVSKYTRVGNLKFDSTGTLTDSNGSFIQGFAFDAKTGIKTPDANGNLTLANIKIPSEVTAAGVPTVPATLKQYSGITIGSSGEITGINSAGTPETLGYLAVAKFDNVDGLSQDGSGYNIQSMNSGQPIVTNPGTNATGKIRSGALEMSNVDLSKEFTDMIIAQRGFQANTKMITVSDTILEELINLKR